MSCLTLLSGGEERGAGKSVSDCLVRWWHRTIFDVAKKSMCLNTFRIAPLGQRFALYRVCEYFDYRKGQCCKMGLLESNVFFFGGGWEG